MQTGSRNIVNRELWSNGIHTHTHTHKPHIQIKGFWPEWCISTIYHAWDTPFWLGTLKMHAHTYTHSLSQDILSLCPLPPLLPLLLHQPFMKSTLEQYLPAVSKLMWSGRPVVSPNARMACQHRVIVWYQLTWTDISLHASTKTECDYLYGWIIKAVTHAKSHQKCWTPEL